LLIIAVCIASVAAGGGRGGRGGGGATPLIIGGYAAGGYGVGGYGGGQSYAAGGYGGGQSYATGGYGGGYGGGQSYAAPYASVAFQPQFYGTSYAQQPQFALAAGGPGPLNLEQGPPGPPDLGGGGGHGKHGKHGGGQQQAFIIAQPVQRVIQPVIQPVHRIIQQPIQHVVQQPMIQGYESEQMEERVFRTPISRTMTELPADVRRVKKTVTQHFPMVHEELTNHYTIQDTQENNIIHHYYEPKDQYLGMMEGQKMTTSPRHVDHPGERYQESPTVVEEMVQAPTKYETIVEQPVVQASKYETFVEQPITKTIRTAPVLREYSSSSSMRATPVLREQFSSSSLREPITVPQAVRSAIYNRNR